MYKTAHPQTVEVKTTRIQRIATPRSNTNDRRGYLALMNLILALFNLIPAFPLDGGRVLRAYLWHRSGNSLSATKTAAKSGGILGYVLIGLGVFGPVSWRVGSRPLADYGWRVHPYGRPIKLSIALGAGRV
jgi:Zn-dependent protease